MKRYLTQSSFLVPGGTLITATRGRTRAGVWRLRGYAPALRYSRSAFSRNASSRPRQVNEAD